MIAQTSKPCQQPSCTKLIWVGSPQYGRYVWFVATKNDVQQDKTQKRILFLLDEIWTQFFTYSVFLHLFSNFRQVQGARFLY